jgi:hypothetical protein
MLGKGHQIVIKICVNKICLQIKTGKSCKNRTSAGVMGSAFSMPLTDNGHGQSRWHHLMPTRLKNHESGVHPRLKPNSTQASPPFTYDRLGEARKVRIRGGGCHPLGIDWAADILSDKLPTTCRCFFTKVCTATTIK